MPTIYFTVTTTLSYDQRMIRICTSLANAGYKVVLVGIQINSSIPLTLQPYKQKRLKCFFNKGVFFYAEYNTRLFIYLLFKKMDGICAVDLDTILPCFIISKIKKIKRIYDAHELFCEMKEVVTRKKIYGIWKWIEQHTVPHFVHGCTVNKSIAEEFFAMYGSHFKVIRNIALWAPSQQQEKKEKYILYQGAVNEGRSFETLIPAMQTVNAPLYICGDGNFMQLAKDLAEQHKVTGKIFFKGMISPPELKTYTSHAYIGLTLFENNGLSNYYSLANRFFDYIQAGVPQLCVNFPEYKEINNLHEVAVLIDDVSPENISRQLNNLINDEEKWAKLSLNGINAAKSLNWQNEEKVLLAFYNNIFG